MEKIKNLTFKGNRVLSNIADKNYVKCVFYDGLYQFKNSKSITIDNCTFFSKYSFWTTNDIQIINSLFERDTRAVFWYTTNLTIDKTSFLGAKVVNYSTNINVSNSKICSDYAFWNSSKVNISSTELVGDYLLYSSNNINIDRCKIESKQALQMCKNIKMSKTAIKSSDILWHAQDGFFENTYFSGKNIGWNSKNLTFNNCFFEGEMPFCYASKIILNNCKFINSEGAFEESDICGTIFGNIKSIFKPKKLDLTIKTNTIPKLISNDKYKDNVCIKIIGEEK
jgi:hypothetical protein